MEQVKLKYLCSSYSTPITQDQIQEAGNYKVYGASGQVGFLAEPGCKSDYLGIIKDGAGVGRISTYEASSYLLGTMAYIVPNLDVDINWLKYAVMSLNLSESISKTTIPHIYFSEYGNRKVSWCTIEEQRSIAVFLDCKCAEIDYVIAATQRTIEEYKKLKQTIITEAVTKGIRGERPIKDSGIEWIGEIPEDWDIKKGKWILSLLDQPVFQDDGVITCFRDGEVTLRSKRREDGFTISLQEAGYQGINVGDLVVHGMDGFAGAIGISDSRGKGTPVLNVLDSTQNKRYIMYYLRSMAYNGVFLALATGIRVRSCDTNWNKLKELPYPKPSIDEQEEIASFIDNKIHLLDELIEKKETLRIELENYKKSVIYEYVTGKKEVPTCQ